MKAVLAALVVLPIFDATALNAAGPKPFPPEVVCSQIREAVHKVAAAERDQALALHLMADGKPTPMVQTRLTQLQAKIGDLREVLRRARDGSPKHNSDASECIAMGFRSLTDAESVSRQIQDIVMEDGGVLALPPQIRSGAPGAAQLPEPPLPPSHAE